MLPFSHSLALGSEELATPRAANGWRRRSRASCPKQRQQRLLPAARPASGCISSDSWVGQTSWMVSRAGGLKRLALALGVPAVILGGACGRGADESVGTGSTTTAVVGSGTAPDGSAVSRTTIGAASTAARPGSTSTVRSSTSASARPTTTLAAGSTGVRGTVTAGPTCPVQRADQPCADRPLAIHVTASGADGRTAGETDSAADGAYALGLAPGRYVVRASSGQSMPRCPDTDVTVPDHGQAVADIVCDTGIR
jgi:hypothetical protein